MKALGLVLVVFACGADAGLGPCAALAVAACLVTCGTTGPGYGLCVAGCTAAAACFDPKETKVELRNGTKMDMSMVPKGEHVKSGLYEDGKPIFTEVLETPVFKGKASYTTMSFEDNSSISVTDNHMMLVHDANKPYRLKSASKVTTTDAVQTGLKWMKVTGIQHSQREGKIDFKTRACTVLANDILTTTSCLDEDISAHMLSKFAFDTSDIESSEQAARQFAAMLSKNALV